MNRLPLLVVLFLFWFVFWHRIWVISLVFADFYYY